MATIDPLAPWINDPTVGDLVCDVWHSLLVVRLNGTKQTVPSPFSSQADVRAWIERRLPRTQRLSSSSPLADAKLAGGHRLFAVAQPLAPHLSIVVRCFRPNAK
jgi:Flp pilus assembly CpaF family ATPase